MVRRIQASRARKEFSELLHRSARGERIKIRRYGTTLAAIIPKADLDKLEDCEESKPPPGKKRAP